MTLLHELGCSWQVPSAASFQRKPTLVKAAPASKLGRTESTPWLVGGAAADPGGRQTFVAAALALAFPEHADAPARGAGMPYSHHSGSAAHNNSQLLPKGIFSCIIYLNTCLRLQGRVRSLSSGGREGGAAPGDLDRFHWKIREWRHGRDGARLRLHRGRGWHSWDHAPAPQTVPR